MREPFLAQSKRVVVKVGSSLLASRALGLQIDRIERLADDLSAIKAGGRDVLLVSSGAIVSGVQKLGLSAYPKSLPLTASGVAYRSRKLSCRPRSYSSEPGPGWPV